MQVTPDQLFQIIGQLQVEIIMLRTENAALRQQLESDEDGRQEVQQ